MGVGHKQLIGTCIFNHASTSRQVTFYKEISLDRLAT